MSGYTKGPWFRDKYGAMVDAKGENILLRGVSTLCSGSDDRMEMAEANTTLACAAPELLEALENAQALYPCDMYAAAIAKARGEV